MAMPYTTMAAAAGGLLAAMIFLNGVLGRWTGPLFSSFIAHGVGLGASLILWVFAKPPAKGQAKLVSPQAPLWAYCGGFGGALAVVASSIAVNSPLGLAGSFSLSILGQTLSSLLIDRFGWLGAAKRSFTPFDGIRVGAVLAGSLLVIQAGGSL